MDKSFHKLSSIDQALARTSRVERSTPHDDLNVPIAAFSHFTRSVVPGVGANATLAGAAGERKLQQRREFVVKKGQNANYNERVLNSWHLTTLTV